MKNIFLIRPYYKEKIKQSTFPLGLGYLASTLRQKGFNVRIYDLVVLGMNNVEFTQKIEHVDVDAIGITALSIYYEAMVELCHLIKSSEKLRSVPLIIGGVHVSALPEFSLKECQADFAVIGEGEQTLLELLNCIKTQGNYQNVKGISFFKNNQYIQTEPRELIKDIDIIPIPAWDLIHPELYPKVPHGLFYKKAPVFPIFSSRGCPFACTYCASANFWRRKIRVHSVKRVVDEIELLVRKYNAKEIHFWDDNFTLDRHRLIKICAEIKRRKLNLYFGCPNGVKVDTFDYNLLKILRAVGFYTLIFAVETVSEKTQKIIDKKLDLKIVPSILQSARNLGFFTRTFFIIGLPGENLNDIHHTIQTACNWPIDYTAFFLFSPLPGSAFFNAWIQKHDLHSIKWEFGYFEKPQDMTGFNSVTIKQLAKLQKYGFIKFFFFHPTRFIRTLLRYHFSQILIFVNRVLGALR